MTKWCLPHLEDSCEQYTILKDVQGPWWKTPSSICIILQIQLSLIQYLLNIKPNLTILGMANDTCNNPLSPSIHIQIPHTDLHTFPLRISWENLIKYQGIFSFVIIFHILTTLSLDNVWTLLGENCCWSLLELKGIIPHLSLVHQRQTQHLQDL